MDPDLFYKVLVPILQLRNTCLLALSSPEGDSNYYSELLNLRDDTTGESIFATVDCVLVCNDCKRLDRTEWLNCNHVPQTAFWLDARKTHRIKMLYRTNPALGKFSVGPAGQMRGNLHVKPFRARKTIPRSTVFRATKIDFI